MTRRSLGLPALLAIGLMYVLPTMAEAQLFPNRTIRRQREACAAEPPFNSHVRRDFYGYYPTCWSRFPDGWACPCPNPELPNVAESFRKLPLSVPPEPGADEPGLGNERDGAMPGEPPAADPNLPPVPDRSRSPFDLPTTPEVPAPPGNTNPPAGPGGSATPSTSGRMSTPPGLREIPSLPAAAPTSTMEESRLEPGSIAMAPDATLASNRPSSRPDLGPLPSTDVGTMVDPEQQPVIGAPTSTPAQAPQRKSLLGGLFGFGNRRRR